MFFSLVFCPAAMVSLSDAISVVFLVAAAALQRSSC